MTCWRTKWDGRISALVPRNGPLREIPKKAQKFTLHLSLTGPVLGQGNGAIIQSLLLLFSFAIRCSTTANCSALTIPMAPAALKKVSAILADAKVVRRALANRRIGVNAHGRSVMVKPIRM